MDESSPGGCSSLAPASSLNADDGLGGLQLLERLLGGLEKTPETCSSRHSTEGGSFTTSSSFLGSASSAGASSGPASGAPWRAAYGQGEQPYRRNGDGAAKNTHGGYAHAPWRDINALLTQRGLPPLLDDGPLRAETPAPEVLAACIQSLLVEHDRLKKHSAAISAAAKSAAEREKSTARRSEKETASVERELARWRHAAEEAQRAVSQAEDRASQSKRAAEEAQGHAREMATSAEKLRREGCEAAAEAERWRHLHEEARKREERTEAAAKEALERLRRAHAASIGAPDTSASAAVSSAARGVRQLDVVRAYEAKCRALEEQEAAANANTEAAKAALRRTRRELRSAGLAAHVREEDGDCYEAEGAQLAGRAHRAELAAARLGDENAALKQRIQSLEKDVSRARSATTGQLHRSLVNAADRPVAQAGSQAGRAIDARRRRRELERAGLTSVEALPKAALVELVQVG
jgi:hypothetical protein